MKPDRSDGRDVVFGLFRLDPERRVLLRGGKAVPLRARSLDILCALIEARGSLVTKAELMARVWPGIFVEENTLQVHVSALRKALGESTRGQRYILTEAGRGYRFSENGEQPSGAMMAPALPDKPSIAVMPFENMSDDREQDYFADGIVEDITTALSQIPWLFVIARNSSFTYRAGAVDVKQVGRELGVRYLLEGSVRRSPDRIRITAQLIDATTGIHLWADRFDGSLADIFDLQDEVTARVVGAITPKLERAEIERAKRKPTESLDAYDRYLRGLASYYHERREPSADALREFYLAIELDPDFALAHGMAARCYAQRLSNNWLTDRLQERAETARLAWRAVELGKDDALALSCAGSVLANVVHDVEAGAALIDRALVLNSNLAYAWHQSGWARVWLGEPELAIDHAARAMRLSPRDPRLFVMHGTTALAHFVAGRYDAAVSWGERVLRAQRDYWPATRYLAASLALGGRVAEARAAIEKMRQLDPDLRISDLQDRLPFRRPDDLARYSEGLRIAGLPE
jgi:TolB-like protein